MFTYRKRRILQGRIRGRLVVALLFVLCAGVTAASHAETRAVEGLEFDSVVVWGSGKAEISQDGDIGLRMRGKDRELNKEPFYLEDTTLHVGRIESGGDVGRVKYKISVGKIRAIRLSGSGEIYVRPLQTEDLIVVLEGSGDIKIHDAQTADLELVVNGSGSLQVAKAQSDNVELIVRGSGSIDLGTVTAQTVEATINGSGDVAVAEEGKAERVAINVMGSGDIDLGGIRAKEADVNIVGSGDAVVWADEDLEASIMGSGDVKYRSDPEVRTNILGSGNVERDD